MCVCVFRHTCSLCGIIAVKVPKDHTHTHTHIQLHTSQTFMVHLYFTRLASCAWAVSSQQLPVLSWLWALWGDWWGCGGTCGESQRSTSTFVRCQMQLYGRKCMCGAVRVKYACVPVRSWSLGSYCDWPFDKVSETSSTEEDSELNQALVVWSKVWSFIKGVSLRSHPWKERSF